MKSKDDRWQMIKRALFLCVVGLFINHAEAACSFQTVTPVNFGAYNPLSSANDDANGQLRVRCTPSASFVVRLSKGSSSTFNPRTLKNGSQTLNYNLFRNAARTEIWGDGTGGTFTVSGSGTNVNITVRGRVPGSQDVSVGSYSDTIVATVTF